jgi:hypothetical protein
MAGFAERHNGCEYTCTATGFTLTGGDGRRADAVLPYLPWSGGGLDAVLAHLDRRRRSLVLVVRRGGYACAVVDTGCGAGDSGDVVASRVGSRHVQARTAAGGWSQQRFARRREKQAAELVGAVAGVAAGLLLPFLDPGGHAPPTWLVTGGDRPLLEAVLGEPRLRALTLLPLGRHLAVGDPDRRWVAGLPELLTSVRVRLA